MHAWLVAALLISLGSQAARAIPPGAFVLDPVATTANTGEKPQSKAWAHAGAWWCVLPKSSGTWLMKLEGTAWIETLQLSTFTNARADVKTVGDVAHIFLFRGTSSQVVSAQYVSGLTRYQPWPLRPAASPVTLDSGVETATIDIDSQGRMWLASDASTKIYVRYSDPPYSGWSTRILVASGVNSDDICVVTAMPDNTIGVMWSNQATRRFGFRTHVDGASPTTWSADEVPASQSAIDNIGAGMADDHLNVKVASDGTLYAAIKTGYDKVGYPVLALLVRRSNGTWDDLYAVSTSLTATRPLVLLNETTQVLTCVFKNGNRIVYSQSLTSPITFGAQQTLVDGALNNPTSTKSSISDEVVVLASSTGNTTGVFWNVSSPPLLALGSVYDDAETMAYDAPDVAWASEDDDDGSWSADGIVQDEPPGAAVDDAEMSSGFSLHPNVPNPFNPTTVIRYEVPASEGTVTLRLYDVSGRLIRTLFDGAQTFGEGSVTWDGTDEHGNPLASGVYFCRLQAPGFGKTIKMQLLR